MPAVRTSWISRCPRPIDSAVHSHSCATRPLWPRLAGSLASTEATSASSVRSCERSSSPYWTKAHRATKSGARTSRALNGPTFAGIQRTTNRKPMMP